MVGALSGVHPTIRSSTISPFVLSKGPFELLRNRVKGLPTHWIHRHWAYFDLPAVLVTFILTVILVKGIKESASFNAVMVAIKLIIVLMVIGIGVFYNQSCQLASVRAIWLYRH